MVATAKRVLPLGRRLPDEVWRSRHRGITLMLWAHVVGLGIFALVRGHGIGHALLESGIVALAAVAADLPLGRRPRAVAATLGILSSSAILVHLSGGAIEAHFHYFVMIGLVILYQDWLPFLLFVVFVAAQHWVMGVLDPTAVFNHPAAVANPLLWAAIHGVFVLAASVASIVAWRRNEVLRERAEKFYQERLEAERALAAAKTELVQTASHELRTPLTVILGFARTLETSWERFSDAERREQVSLMRARASQLNRLIDSFLTLEKLEAGDVPPATEVEVDRVVEQALEDVGLSSAARRIDGRPRAQGNEGFLYQILINYLTNAQKYGAPPYAVDVRTDERWVEVLVRDGGEGLPPDATDRIFDRFRQGAATHADGGFGLGLSIVDRLARVHGGEAWYEANAPKGASFGVRLPRTRQPAPTG